MNDFWNGTGRLEEERTIEEEFILTKEDAGQVPRTVTRDGVTYVLDESSIELQVSKKELWRDQQIMEEYVSYAVEDNDIERLQKEITRDGNVLKMIEVDYHVTEETPSGLPLAYEAVCRYAANVDRDREVPIQWKATANYTGTVADAVQEEEAVPGDEAGEEEMLREEEVLREEENETAEGEEKAQEKETVQGEESLQDAVGEERVEETEIFAEEAVPMAASVNGDVVLLNDTMAGVLGAALLGAAFVFCVLFRKRKRSSGDDASSDGRQMTERPAL
ncbi:MAG: hypothetical protein HFI66_09475 [Lachnospiraceae bacterium]|jgi:hypothetical protein|nr:hypothetical protein [Lachnospiraceae bacterium]